MTLVDGSLDGKSMVYFLFALIELFSLSVTVPELRGEICTAQMLSLGADLFALKFHLDRFDQPFLASETEPLGYPKLKTASLCVPSF